MVDAAVMESAPSATKIPFDQRRELLATEVSRLLALGNRRIESFSDLSAVVVIGKPVNHLLHLVATVLTLGIWSLIWLILVLTAGEKRELVRVTESGDVTIQEMKQ
jgi:hypothetical protein